ncbi:Chlorophyll a/b binding protein domain-containing protein [Artemisia annua]|uniref:Chlorophyll a/b binding protein domain-containing protein n=1 Tax=Artemisia annua TaxID=35608 RepID=A0A2U1N9T1_ARTAN|nr:Chlorophyll a/b binding protein domain-containing protein [Artemisia annua]
MSIASLQYMKLSNSPSTNRPIFTVRCSQADGGQLRRPSVATPIPVVSPLPEKMAVAAVVGEKSGVTVTMEYQRQRAKEMQQYFKKKKSEESSQGPFFGFLPKNEISNGRWAMFGFAVGMLTEYATGSDFVDQVKILLSNFGIVDLE